MTPAAMNILAQATASAPSAYGARAFWINLLYLAAAACFIIGLRKLSSPRSARQGNFTSSMGMLLAVLATLLDRRIVGGGYGWIFAGLIVGGGIGLTLAKRVNMRGMPQMVALLNGFGGLAAALVGYGKYLSELHEVTQVDFRISVALSELIGMITFTGSLIAWAKLEELKVKIPVPGRGPTPITSPVVFPQQKIINLVLVALLVLLSITIAWAAHANSSAILLLLVAAVAGVVLVLPIGGADMPVIIALLNSFSGLGAAATGFVLHNNALIIGGSLVGAAGFILTLEMCRAMNRSVLHVVAGGFGGGPPPSDAGSATASAANLRVQSMVPEEAAILLENARNVIIVPGYGMAVAQAQHVVADLASTLIKRGTSVKFAVHPVAGRMPGHMNVLLAEANVPYELLADLEINPEFEQCDVALVIGANDVVNPSARTDKSSPIYGMPIFDVDKSKAVLVSKRSLNPGFAGVENALFYLPNTFMLFGDAKATMTGIANELKARA